MTVYGKAQGPHQVAAAIITVLLLGFDANLYIVPAQWIWREVVTVVDAETAAINKALWCRVVDYSAPTNINIMVLMSLILNFYV